MSMISRELGLCLVCGSSAIGINFRVPTCAPCKAFFRRNAVKLGSIEFKCQQDGDCPVTYKSRRMCNCCRLAKCFRVGMQKSLIRSDAERLERKALVQRNRQKRMQLLMTQNSDSIQPTTIYYLSQNSLEFLSSTDQILLNNIFGAYERIYPETSNCQYPYFPAIEHSTIHTFFNEYEKRHKLLFDYFKLIPEFNRLTINDKIRLMRNHFGTMANINEQILIRTIPPALVVSFNNIFDTNFANDLLCITKRILTYTHDPILLKLILITGSLSSGIQRYRNDNDMDRIYDDTLTIFAGQNVYVELLWRYLLSRLPSEVYIVKFFNRLIIDLLFLQSCTIALDRYMYSIEDEIDMMEPLMQSMWPKAEIVNDYDDIDLELYSEYDTID